MKCARDVNECCPDYWTIVVGRRVIHDYECELSARRSSKYGGGSRTIYADDAMNLSLMRCKTRTPPTAPNEIRREPGYGSITKSATQIISVILATS